MPLETNIIGGLLQKKPDLPDFIPVNVQDEQRKALLGNIGAFEQINTLGERVQGMQLDQLTKGLEQILPGAGDLKDLATQRLSEGLRGELPQDVQDFIARQAAERGISTGTGGSQFAQFGELQSLGLTSLAQTQQSLDTALRWITTAQSTVPVFDPSSFFITPTFQAQFAQSERDRQLGVETSKAQLDAAFDPQTIVGQSIVQSGNEFANFVSGIISSGSIADYVGPSTTAGTSGQPTKKPSGGGGGGGGGMGGSLIGTVAAGIISDRDAKEEIIPINEDFVLDSVKTLPIFEWNYRGDEEKVKHIGPMAQDFHDWFGYGGSSRMIHVVDMFGVALSGIKSLLGKVEKLEQKLEDTTRELMELKNADATT